MRCTSFRFCAKEATARYRNRGRTKCRSRPFRWKRRGAFSCPHREATPVLPVSRWFLVCPIPRATQRTNHSNWCFHAHRRRGAPDSRGCWGTGQPSKPYCSPPGWITGGPHRVGGAPKKTKKATVTTWMTPPLSLQKPPRGTQTPPMRTCAWKHARRQTRAPRVLPRTRRLRGPSV